MTDPDAPSTLCPIDRAASVIADRWTLLILRELRLGNDRFDGLQAQTGMSSNLLAQRLKVMEAHGLVVREPYQEHPRRFAYAQTEKARELDGLMLGLAQWGLRHCGFAPDAEPAVTLVHRRTGAVIDTGWTAPEVDQPFRFDQVERRISPRWAAERAARADAFATDKRLQVAKRTPHRAAGLGKAPGRKRAVPPS